MTAANPNGIRIQGLSKAFHTKSVLKCLDFFFPAGKITCIMGKSGCGKTTLLRILMGLETADEGTVSGLPGRISAVFQEDRLAPEFSVLTNVLLPLEAGSETEKEQQKSAALSLLKSFGLEESSGKKVRELSGGMSRRVAIARALLVPHELLILDEPLKGLDEGTRDQVIHILRKHGKTILMVTHDPEEARLLGADIITM